MNMQQVIPNLPEHIITMEIGKFIDGFADKMRFCIGMGKQELESMKSSPDYSDNETISKWEWETSKIRKGAIYYMWHREENKTMISWIQVIDVHTNGISFQHIKSKDKEVKYEGIYKRTSRPILPAEKLQGDNTIRVAMLEMDNINPRIININNNTWYLFDCTDKEVVANSFVIRMQYNFKDDIIAKLKRGAKW